MKFSEMPYKRAELEEYGPRLEKIISEFDAADAAGQERLFKELEKIASELFTMESLAHARHTINTEDKFYDAEKDYYDEKGPLYQEIFFGFSKKLIASGHRPELEKRLGSLLFLNTELELKAFSPEIVPELQEENRLASEYEKLIASAQIPFEGKILNLAQLGPYKESPDRAVRKAAYLAESGFLEANAARLDEIFDKLVAVRDRMAKKLGFENYVPLGYLRMRRNCYSPCDVDVYCEQVRDGLVPIVSDIKKKQAARIGVDAVHLYDNPLFYKSGNAMPEGTPEQIFEAGRKMYHSLSAETGEFIDFMLENELFDVLTRKGKAAGGYCTYFSEYKSPFIFANFNGTSGDIDVLTHEAGHAFAAYLSRDVEILEYQNPTLEACEIHSMSMEFLTYPWMESFFGPKADKYKYYHLSDGLSFIPYGVAVDRFQHIIYENPGMTPSERNAAWLRIERQYRPYLQLLDVPHAAAGGYWQRQTHIYSRPFYYIDYCLAQTVALQIFALSSKDHAAAWQKYLAFTRRGGTDTYCGLVAGAELLSPFDDGSLEGVFGDIAKYLNSFDDAALDK